MTNAVRRIASRRMGQGAFVLSGILIPILAVMLAPAFGATPTSRDLAKGGPRLASMQIEIWPEYDRPAALVILRGEIATGVALPAAVSLRIAAASGGPAAVAYSAESSGNLLNLKYERKDADDFITLNFDAPQRFFHIEFYEPLVTTVPGRNYTYVWMGDLASDRMNVILQEPATASDLSVQPGLETTTVGQNGLRYRSAELGPFPMGKRLEVKVRYTKTDLRTSTQILNPKTPDTLPVPVEGPTKKDLALWLVAVVAVLVVGALVASTWWYRRKSASAPQPGDTGFCRKCKAPLASGDRFCSKCGTPLA